MFGTQLFIFIFLLLVLMWLLILLHTHCVCNCVCASVHFCINFVVPVDNVKQFLQVKDDLALKALFCPDIKPFSSFLLADYCFPQQDIVGRYSLDIVTKRILAFMASAIKLNPIQKKMRSRIRVCHTINLAIYTL